MKISIIGLGFVGTAINQSFASKGIQQVNYDKYKNIGTIEDCLEADILFLCLPTVYSEVEEEYDKSALHEILSYMVEKKYNGVIVIKSTIEPQTTEKLYKAYGLKHHLNLIHNPEFLTAATAFEDFHNQTHIVLGRQPNCSTEATQQIKTFYTTHYPKATISLCTSNESESMKIFVNNFYASKIQLFNEYYLLCKKTGIDYNNVRDLMLKNKWINPMHTKVPGTDGQLSYGGQCFSKDTNALNNFMKKENTPNKVLNAVIEERNTMRNDSINIDKNSTIGSDNIL
jgi:UDPglucose 6-dehydrogenase